VLRDIELRAPVTNFREVEEATQRLEHIINAEPKYNPWFLVFTCGLASA